ncbi:hypothetical protein RJ639_022685, partial [Escallonia herrerae]
GVKLHAVLLYRIRSKSCYAIQLLYDSSPSLFFSGRNVYGLLARREISPRMKCVTRRQWGEAAKRNIQSSLSDAMTDARRELFSWVEAESFQHLSATYCSLVPPPRSTIAAAFSPDGKTLASTHGDHTVKVIDCQTGSCLQVLTGHRRTPWVVRFHPVRPEILASGSLDHEVRLWNANTSECIGSRDFCQFLLVYLTTPFICPTDRPIASIAFHAGGELLAVASGHKLYLWHYNSIGDASSPSIVLKTKRSLRAVHFHPHGAPFLLTAEVNDLDSSDSSVARPAVTSLLHYPPAAFVGDMQSSNHLSSAAELPLMSLPRFHFPSLARVDSRIDLQVRNRVIDSGRMQVEAPASVQFQLDADSSEPNDHMISPMETSTFVPLSAHATGDDTVSNHSPGGMQIPVGDAMDALEASELPSFEGHQQGNVDTSSAGSALPISSQYGRLPGTIPSQPGRVSAGNRQHHLPSRDPTCWELPFLQGWLLGQSQAGMPSVLPYSGVPHGYSSSYTGVGSSTLTSDLAPCNGEFPVASVARSGLGDHSSRVHMISSPEFGQGAPSISNPNDGRSSLPVRIQSELAMSLAATPAAELPCTVKLRIWPHDLKDPCTPLNDEKCRLTIPHAVLCSEMGAHFSPCGRYLAACVAIVRPHFETDPGSLSQLHQNIAGAATSPTQHPTSACQVTYELRIYSLEESTFGSVLISTAIRAAHCLTSIQFSPNAEHILLAYGRRHSSLLKSIVVNGETSLPVYTVLEVYRVSDMQLVSVLPSTEDEVNVACFHPLAGGGLIYGTKEGKLRVLQYTGSHGLDCTRLNLSPEENMVEVKL